MTRGPSLRTLARGASGLAGLAGAAGFLSLMGAFGPVSCVSSSVGSGGGRISRRCVAGIDYLFGSAGGNAPVLFFWAIALLLLVALGCTAGWTGRRHVTWGATIVGVGISTVGIMSIGTYFLLPTLFLLVAATVLTVDALRDGTDGESVTSRRAQY